MRRVTVGRSSARFIRQGHPWLRPDRFTRGLEACQPGEAITLVDERGAPLASALADPGAAIGARVYVGKGAVAFDPHLGLERAWQRRADLHADTSTDCYRLVHGEADALPGLRAERYGDVVVLLQRAACLDPHIDAIAAWFAKRLPGTRIILRQHLDDLRRQDTTARLWPRGTVDPDEIVWGRERGVAVACRPFDGLATGIYVDHRATRAWLAEHIAGKRVLNLFAYTGLFSVAALVDGAATATDVDSSGPALNIGALNATRNEVGERRRGIQTDCFRFCEEDDGHYDIVIIDPPTAARGGSGWVLRRDYRRLLQAVLKRCAPGALIVACCNTLNGGRFDLAQCIDNLGVDLDGLAAPEMGLDCPQKRGFPEGRPWQAVARRLLTHRL